ncbi:MAG: short-chain dehydrogenase/reductase [Ilumatobacteraceae bacterium]|nr:short-chain dehydrogenase/reductase [Ilumatobacteraceae bacterium]MCU1389749.1 short-chain dehydrogenase/reductase [Ilumatobacteraceae bacterium]
MHGALITGASRGFGWAIAAELASAGWDLVIDGRDATRLAAAVRSLGPIAERAGGTVTAIAGDVSDPGHRRALADAAAELDHLDLVVNNASVLGPSPQPRLADYPLEVFSRVVDVNVTGPLGLLQLTLPALRESNGVIVNVTSDAAVEGYAGWGGYGASKAALEQLSNVLAAEEPDVRVYWFDPGDMRTAMHQEAFPGDDISDRPLPETVVPALRSLLAARPPSGRIRASAWQGDSATSEAQS